MQVIRNFIENKRVFNELKSTLTGTNFPWYFCGCVGSPEDTKDFYFLHALYDSDKQLSDWFNKITRANLYTKHSAHENSTMHRDSPEPHTVALFYVNTCNGYTEFADGTKIKSEENKIVIFNGSNYHSSVTQTDTKQRICININIS
jgi:hypothetical protein